MQEVIRRCDREVKGGKPCGKVVPDNSPSAFSLGATTYEVDLCSDHYTDLVSALEPFMAIAHPVRGRANRAVRNALKGKHGAVSTKDVRNWLREQGKEVSPTGRIPNALIEEYQRAQQPQEGEKVSA